MCCGPNVPIPGMHGGAGAGYSSFLWNMRGLIHNDFNKRALKTRALKNFLGHYDALAVVEAHCISGQADAYVQQFGNRYHIFYSAGRATRGIGNTEYEDKATGGVFVFLLKSKFLGWSVDFSEVVPGRVVLITSVKEDSLGSGDEKTFYQWFVHNSGLDGAKVKKFERLVHSHMDAAEMHPNNVAVFLSGDVNLKPILQHPVSLDKPDQILVRNTVSSLPPRPSHRPFQAIWEKVFARFLEIEVQGESHVNLAKLSMSTLDRTFIKIPRSVIPFLTIEGQLHSSPMRWMAKGISDHSPCSLRLRPKKSARSTPHRIPIYVAKHPIFKEKTEKYFEMCNLENVEINEAIGTAKDLIHEAARATRLYILQTDKDGFYSQLCALSGIAKAV